MKKRISNLLLVLFFLTAQLFLGVNTVPRAAASDFSVKVVVQSYDKVLAEGTSTKSNALDAAEALLKSKGVSYEDNNKTYLSQIGGVVSGRFGGWDGWLFTVNRNGEYLNTGSNGINQVELKSGDKLIVYYGDFGVTNALNNLDFSTEKSGDNLEIDINNNSYNTVTPITGLTKVTIDGIEYSVTENKIKVPQGLSYGKHVLKVSDFRTDMCPKVVADDNIIFDFGGSYVRVEGLSGSIAEGFGYGKNLLERVTDLLKKNNVPYTLNSQWNYIDSINNIKEGKFGGYDGWMCYYKNGSTVASITAGMADIIPESGNKYIVYYGDMDKTPFINKALFNPSVVKAGEGFKIQFIWKHTPWGGDAVEKKVADAIVTIDDTNYITDTNGEVTVKGLTLGEHSYKISGYNVDKLPTVVMDKGTFVIDNYNTPSFESNPQQSNGQDNSNVIKDVNKETDYVEGFMKANADDPWAALSMQKLGLKGGESFIKDSAASIAAGELEYFSNTDLEKLIMNLTALGYNPYNFQGKDLVSELLNRNESGLLINDAAFGLLAYNYANIKGSYNLTKDKLINIIMNKKLSYTDNGRIITGWALSGSKINPDITGIVLSSLAPYNDDSHPEVQNVIKDAVNSLSSIQNDNGYLSDSFGVYSESQSFAIIGLVAVGENPEGAKFTKAKGDLVSALISFKGTDGQYKHELTGANNYMATEEAFRAFYALSQYKANGKYNFYESSIDAQKLPIYNYSDETTSETGNEEILPQTGSVIDNTMIFSLGMLLIISGAAFILLQRRRNN